MIVTFIYPAIGKKENRRYLKNWKMEPLPITTLAAITPPEIEIKFYDDRLEKMDYDHQTDLVAINTETYSAMRAYQIASEFRKRGVKVVMGGYHATLVPEDTQAHCDSVIIGEAENVWTTLLEDAKNATLKARYHSSIKPIFGNVLPRRDILKGKKYSPLTLIETSRGCPYSCNFCSINAYYNQAYTFRDPAMVIKEIDATNARVAFFVDDNILANPARAKVLFKMLAERKIKWFGQFSINMANDLELLKLMKQSGCEGGLIGFESLNKKNLDLMGKTWNSATTSYEDAIKKIRDAGLCIYSTFVFGHDYDDHQSFDLTMEFALKQKFYFSAFNHLIPFPGTALYKKFEQEKRLLFDKWWLDPNYSFGQMVFKPNNFTVEEFEARCNQARHRFYRWDSIISRGMDFRANSSSLVKMAIFYYLNLKEGREVGERIGVPLGRNLDTDFK